MYNCSDVIRWRHSKSTQSSRLCFLSLTFFFFLSLFLDFFSSFVRVNKDCSEDAVVCRSSISRVLDWEIYSFINSLCSGQQTTEHTFLSAHFSRSCRWISSCSWDIEESIGRGLLLNLMRSFCRHESSISFAKITVNTFQLTTVWN